MHTHTDGVWPEPSVSSCGPSVSAPCVPLLLPVLDVTPRCTCSLWRAGQEGYLVNSGLLENVPKYCCSCHLNLEDKTKLSCLTGSPAQLLQFITAKQHCFISKRQLVIQFYVTFIYSHCACKQVCWPRCVTEWAKQPCKKAEWSNITQT